MIERQWNLVMACDHRFFYGDESTGIAVADNSGETPDATDDGILWLDFSRPITQDESYQWFIPLRRHGGDPDLADTKTPASWHEVVMVASRFREIKVIDHEGNVVPIYETLWDIKPKREEDYL